MECLQMADKTDTFDRPHYLHGTAAGFKGETETGKAAAAMVNETLGRRHKQMLEAWKPFGAAGAIPEQVAEKLELPVHIVRPRAGELVKRGLFFPVGKRAGGLGCEGMAYSTVKPTE